MKRVYVAMVGGVIALFGLAVLKNHLSYSYKSVKWRIGKSFIDTAVVVSAAMYMPAMLIGWIVLWLTRPITRRGISITLAIMFGVFFGAIGGVVLELLCVLGIAAVDLLTGQQGVYGWWQENPPESFMPFLLTKRSEREVSG